MVGENRKLLISNRKRKAQNLSELVTWLRIDRFLFLGGRNELATGQLVI